MYNFCTLFDSAYLIRGLAMYESLFHNCPNLHLYLFAFDDKCYETLIKLNLINVTVISLKEFEDARLLEVKPQRSKAEYCWTCTPSVINFVLENYNVDTCTYLDADLYFYASPEFLLNELGNNSVIITEHRFTPKYEWRLKYGKYCVQFVTFKKDVKGMSLLKHWRDDCLNWCFARLEDGKFGDQKYLDEWPESFDGVHILRHLGGLAPWNIQQYDICVQDSKYLGKEKRSGQGFDAVFYHFHYLKYFANGTIDLGPYELSDQVKELVYWPYIRHLEEIKSRISSIDRAFDSYGGTMLALNDFPLLLRYAKHFLQHNIVRINDILR